MIRTLFVLDMDATYDNEVPDSLGVPPSVYLIPVNKQIEVEHFAVAASLIFQQTNTDECIGDIFEGLLKRSEIPFQYVGSIDITFEERQVDYLVDYIPREIV